MALTKAEFGGQIGLRFLAFGSKNGVTVPDMIRGLGHGMAHMLTVMPESQRPELLRLLRDSIVGKLGQSPDVNVYTKVWERP